MPLAAVSPVPFAAVAPGPHAAARGRKVKMYPMSDPVDVPIDDEVIRLGQFLKLANLIDSGSEAKTVIAAGLVRVNDEVELRRGRQLQARDVGTIDRHRARGSDPR